MMCEECTEAEASLAIRFRGREGTQQLKRNGSYKEALRTVLTADLRTKTSEESCEAIGLEINRGGSKVEK